MSVSIDFVIPNGITPLATFIAGVALYSIDPAIFYPLHNANVVWYTVLGPGEAAWIVPVEENYIPWIWRIAPTLARPNALDAGLKKQVKSYKKILLTISYHVWSGCTEVKTIV